MAVAVQKWEYRYVNMNNLGKKYVFTLARPRDKKDPGEVVEDVEVWLQSMGTVGWELVAHTFSTFGLNHEIFVFKRPKD